MARSSITKAELAQQLATAQQDNEALRAQLEALRAELEALKAQAQSAQPEPQRAVPEPVLAQAPSTPAARTYVRRAPDHSGKVLDELTGRWMLPGFIAARDAAMRTGRSVRVGA